MPSSELRPLIRPALSPSRFKSLSTGPASSVPRQLRRSRIRLLPILACTQPRAKRRQMPTRERREHLGLPSSGGGTCPPCTTVRNRRKDYRVSERSSSSKGMRTRSLEPAKYRTPSEQR